MEHCIGSITKIKTFCPDAGWKGWGKHCSCKRCLLPLGLVSLDHKPKPCGETTQPVLLQNALLQIIFQVQIPLAITVLLICGILYRACLARSLEALQYFLEAEVASWSGGRQMASEEYKSILNSCLCSLKISTGNKGSEVLEIFCAVVNSESNLFA